MRKEFPTTNTRFIYSKDELGYQDVLDRFNDASEITIITYNISEKKNELVKALQSVGENCRINVITNIPSRWETYYGDSFRMRAKQKINLYMSKLRPENIGLETSVFFDFSNHGKIIMTDSIAYVGSANYSEESANNTEFGFICEDKSFIDFINAEVLPEVQRTAIPYYKYNYTALLVEANVAIAAIHNVKNELYEEAYRLHDDVDGEWYYYIDNEASLSARTLDNIIKVVEAACKVASEVFDAIDVITNSDEKETMLANDAYEELLSNATRIEEVKCFDTLYELAHFDYDDCINEQLQDEFAMEAFEENLEDCIDSASGYAMSRVYELTHNAKEDIE